jgi:hypothetical protein
MVVGGQHHEHGTEQLVLRNCRVLVGADEQRRLVEEAAREVLRNPATDRRGPNAPLQPP